MVGLWWSDSGGVVMSGPTAWAGDPHAFACRLNDFDGLRESIMFRAPPPPHPPQAYWRQPHQSPTAMVGLARRRPPRGGRGIVPWECG